MSLPEEVDGIITDIDGKISEFEEALEHLLAKQNQENTSPYEVAKLNLCLAYMLNNLFCSMTIQFT